jgi:uncharacterized protein
VKQICKTGQSLHAKSIDEASRACYNNRNPPDEVNKVTNPRKPLRLNVGFLINAPIGVYREFYFDSITVQADEDISIGAVEGEAKISRTPQGLLVQGKFSGETRLGCVRCLGEYQQALAWEFTELYAFDSRSETESGLIIPEDAHIDLESLVRDFALLEFPIKPLCRAECKGLCPVCGENLNDKDCGHRPEADIPFTTLKDLLN